MDHFPTVIYCHSESPILIGDEESIECLRFFTPFRMTFIDNTKIVSSRQDNIKKYKTGIPPEF